MACDLNSMKLSPLIVVWMVRGVNIHAYVINDILQSCHPNIYDIAMMAKLRVTKQSWSSNKIIVIGCII